jgi:outer membrane protein assembly factor BamD (BamD/ComL family)
VPADSLLEEVSLLDRARASLGRHDGTGALRAAEDYLAQFPNGRLRMEAAVIRVYALLLAKGLSAAGPAAEDFVRRHPDSPHAARLRRILAASAQVADR